MSKCKKVSPEGVACGADIIWEKKPEGGFYPPKNPDGSRHVCGFAVAPARNDTITGLLVGFTTGSATFRLKGGATKTYALHQSTATAWQTAGYGPDKWIEFTVDKDHFVEQGARNVNQPDWGAELKDPTNGEIKTPDGKEVPPFTRASELPKETCTSPETAPALTQMRTPDPQKFTERDLFSPRDRLIVLQSTLKACADVFAITTTPDSMDFDTAMDLIIARAIKDTDTLMKAGVP
jgi:hypothetical protein